MDIIIYVVLTVSALSCNYMNKIKGHLWERKVVAFNELNIRFSSLCSSHYRVPECDVQHTIIALTEFHLSY